MMLLMMMMMILLMIMMLLMMMMMSLLMIMMLLMMMMMMRRPSSLRVRAKPRHLPYIYVGCIWLLWLLYIWLCYIDICSMTAIFGKSVLVFLTFGPWGPSGPWPFVMLSTGSLHIIYVVAPAAKGLSK